MTDPGALRLPSLDGLRALDAAVRHGSFERAAEELAITASAVAKRVATVESLLGTPLLERGGRSLLPTAAGQEYLRPVRAALELLAAVPLHRPQVQRRNRLRVVAPPTFARQILVPRLEAFTGAHPGLELEVMLSIPFLDAALPQAEVLVRHGDPAVLGGTVLMHERVLPLAAPSLLARELPRRSPADLRHWPLLRTPLEPWAPWLRAAGLPEHEPDQGPRLVDLGLTLEAAVAGQGVALARPSLARHWLASGALRPVFTLSAEPAAQYLALGADGHRAAAAFVRWLQQACEDETSLARALLPS